VHLKRRGVDESDHARFATWVSRAKDLETQSVG
jgi:hypothetical protein